MVKLLRPRKVLRYAGAWFGMDDDWDAEGS